MAVGAYALGPSPETSGCTSFTFGSSEYWACTNLRSRLIAQTNCQNAGGNLVRIDDAAENTAVRQNIAVDSWIGGSDLTTEGEFLWVDGDNGTKFWTGGPPPGSTCTGTGESQFSGKCYFGVATQSTATTFSAARSSCQGRGTGWDLAVIGDRAENVWIHGFIKNRSLGHWIGAQDVATNDWRWLPPNTGFWSGTAKTCSNGVVAPGPGYGCVIADTVATSWSTCRSTGNGCKYWGSSWDILAVKTVEMNDVAASASSTYDRWIGGTDNPSLVPGASNNNWYWIDATKFWTGTASGTCESGAYCAWDPLEPNNSSGGANDCARLGTDDEWWDASCGSSYRCTCFGPNTGGGGAVGGAFTFWDQNEPTTTGDCARMKTTGSPSGEWAATNCSNNQPYLCEGPLGGNGSCLTYCNWASGEPDNSDGAAAADCARMLVADGTWRDDDCASGHGYVCEIPDQCLADPNKTSPGQCGCGVPDTDTDNDGTADCNDGCPAQAGKSNPGACGCGFPDVDGDGDGTADCIDQCPQDARRIVAPCSPDSDCVFSSFGGSDYFFCNNKHDYATAKAKCEAVGFQLARVDSAAENAYLASQISDDRWIGGNDLGTEGTWIWDAGGTQFWQGLANGSAVGGAFTAWRNGEPDNLGGTQNCLQIFDEANWNDDHCNETEEFICETSAPVFAFPRGCGDTGGLEPGSPWPMGRRCPSGMANTPLFGSHVSTINWSVNLGGAIRNAPAVAADGTIYVGSDANKLVAIGPDGAIKWQFLTGGDIRSSAAIGRSGTVYFGSNDGKLYALNRTGSQQWSFNAGSPVETSPLVADDGTVYFATSGPTGAGAYALNPNGTQRWFTPAAAGMTTEIALARTGNLYVGSGMLVLGIDRDFGVLTQDYELSSPVTGGPVVAGDGIIYVGTQDGRLVAIDGPVGAIAWAVQLPCPGPCAVGDPALSEDDSTVYFGSENGYVYALDADGNTRWFFAAGSPVKAAPVVAGDGVIYVGADDAKLYALKASLDDADRSIWQANLGGAVRAGIAIGRQGTVYAGADAGSLYAIGQNTGKCPTGTACTSYELFSGCTTQEGTPFGVQAPPPCGPAGQCAAAGLCVTVEPGADRACYVPCYGAQ